MPRNDRPTDAPFPLSAHARVGPAITALGRYVTGAYRRSLEPTGLAARHVAALRRLGGGPVAQGELAVDIGLDAARLVGILNELEGEGLVARRRDPRDRRRHTVTITELGAARLAGVEHAVASVENELLAGLDPVARTYLAQTLEAMARRVGSTPAESLEDEAR